MDIATKNITTGIFGGAANYYVAGATASDPEVQNPAFTTYALLFTNVNILITNIKDDITSVSAPQVKASEAIGKASVDLYFSGNEIDDLVFIAASTTDMADYGIDAETIESLELTKEDIKVIIDIAKSYDSQITGYLKDETYLSFNYLTAAEVDALPAKTKSGQLAIEEFNYHREEYTETNKPTAEAEDLGFTDVELLALGVTRLDVADGTQNVCTIRALSYAKTISDAVAAGASWAS